MAIRVGVVGLGMMGMTHLDVYRQQQNVELAAICDSDENRLYGREKATGNVEGQAQGSLETLTDVKRYTSFDDLLNDPQIDLIDVCLPTHLHAKFAVAVLEAGKHCVIEKPLARNLEQGRQILEAAERAPGMAFVALCMRFWPGWDWLKLAIDEKRYGNLHALTIRRLCSMPPGPFYANGDLSGGAILDLHIHDTDFVQYCLGMPQAVTSFGYSRHTSEPDHVVTNYAYEGGPLVVAEGGWTMSDSFGFVMGYVANFDEATAVYDSAASDPLTLSPAGGEPAAVELATGMGYQYELDYFVECIAANTRPRTATVQDAYQTLQIIDAETRSIRDGKTIQL